MNHIHLSSSPIGLILGRVQMFRSPFFGRCEPLTCTFIEFFAEHRHVQGTFMRAEPAQ